MPKIPQFEEGQQLLQRGLRPSNEAITAFRQAGRMMGYYGLEGARLVERGYAEAARGIETIGTDITKALSAQEKAERQQQSLAFTTAFAQETTQFDSGIHQLLGIGMAVPGLGKFSPSGFTPSEAPAGQEESGELTIGGALETQ